jgi:hypothetical protein
MLRCSIPLAVLLACLPAAWGQDAKSDAPKKEAASPADTVKALQEEYAKAQQEYLTAVRAATTTDERRKIYQEKYPNPQKFAARFMEIADKHPTDPAAVDALVWVARNAGYMPEGLKAIETLANKHADDPKVASLAPSLARSQSPHAEKILRAGYEKGATNEAKGQACFNLAQYLHGQAKPREGKPNPEKLKEAEKFFEIVVKEYADIKYGRGTLGESAEGNLFEIRNLSIGQTVPEVEGEDTDGKKFKLSDYRGKVVLIDFWGHW